ncbi:diguanylate cyclase domain-containing protein [Caldimonas tepidiphila]|uniref:diguanylate cyclase domain-containing protein n=1 Tax=Caldimonas tepidiphila TaxID=2315841 RepID=UPI001475A353|nr:diguanylate cyclase [Caldimonas tepidiphila]
MPLRPEDPATILERVTDAFFAVDAGWRFTYVNARAEALLRRPASELLGQELWTAFPQALGSIFEHRYRQALAEQQTVCFEAGFPPLDLWVEVRAYPGPGGLSVYFRDVTAQRQAEAALQEREERLRLFIENASDSLLLLDRESRFLFVSPTLERDLGHAPQRLLGTPASALVHPEDWPAAAVAIERAFRHPGTTQITEVRVRDAAGAWRPCEAVGRTGPPGTAVQGLIVNLRDMSAWQAAEAARRAEAERFRALSASSPVGIFQSDAEGRITYANPRLQSIWCMTEAGMLGSGWQARLHPDDLPAVLAAWRASLEETQAREESYRLLLPDGTTRHVCGQAAPLRDASGALIGSVGTVWDVTERRRIERALAESERSLRLALGAGRMVAWDRDLKTGMLHERGGMPLLPRAPCTVVPQGSAEGGPHTCRHGPYVDFLSGVLPEDRGRLEVACTRALEGRGDFDEEFRIVLPSGGTRWLHAMGRVVPGGDGTPERLVGVSLDITERKALEAELTRRAHRDTLTRLENRDRFRERVEDALAAFARQGAGAPPPVVLFGDLDDFKTVNDSLGHEAGDRLLVLVAERLQQAARGSDSVARLGGDEFAVLLGRVRDIGEAAAIAARIVDSINQPFLLDGRQIHIGASIGIAMARPGDTPHELLRNADLAMYRAKNGGKRRHETFTPEMHAAALDRLTLGDDLHRALDAGELLLHYQPIVELGSRRITGAEALMRWRHPARGLVPPGTFIPIAEETGLIPALGRWVLAEACANAARWPRAADAPPLALTVNVSARQLQEAGLVGDVRRALQDCGLPPSALVLEITESTLMQDRELMLRRLQELKALGVKIAIDDFGTGFSSLAYLQRYPIDVLKIDKSFVDRVAEGDRDGAVTRTIVALADALELRSVAEGVEHAEQEARLLQLGCRFGQGYLFARPMPGEALDALLRQPFPLAPPSPPVRETPAPRPSAGRAPLTADEDARIALLSAIGLLDSEPEAVFDRVTRLASRLFGTPIALISLIDEQRQWFKSRVGMEPSETPREGAFCAHAIHQQEPLVVPDARRDERFADSPLVSSAPHIRFYAGAPLRSLDGTALGTLCVKDRLPREFSAQDAELLRDLAAIVSQELVHRELALRARSALIFHVETDAEGRGATFRHASDKLAELVGSTPGELRQHPDRFFSALHPDDRLSLRELAGQLGSGETGRVCEFRLMRTPGGPTTWCEAHVSSRRLSGSKVLWTGYLVDITGRKALEQQLTRLAYHDALTGLENRMRFRERVEAALAVQRAGADADGVPAVLFADLDDFKPVNDALGHEAGDRLLVLVAQRLRQATRGSDTVARLGGDEFAVLLDRVHSLEEASLIAQRIVDSVAEPFVLDGQRIRIGASVGITLVRPEDTPEGLLRNADLAMYRAKHRGKGRHVAVAPGRQTSAA